LLFFGWLGSRFVFGLRCLAGFLSSSLFIYLFIVVKARETNRVNDITVGQKGT